MDHVIELTRAAPPTQGGDGAMVTLLVLFIICLVIGLAIAKYWRQFLVIVAAVCVAAIFTGVLEMIAAISRIRGHS
jgi:undecaprenyl pyrophosphate phosphatase UppP